MVGDTCNQTGDLETRVDKKPEMKEVKEVYYGHFQPSDAAVNSASRCPDTQIDSR